MVRLIDDDGQSDTTVYTYFTQLGAPPVIDTMSPTSAGANSAMQVVGRGFDVEAASQGKGLGLTSMRERVRLVNGTISIESKPMGGTTIHVRVPFGSEQSFQRQAV